jgi:dihydroorotase
MIEKLIKELKKLQKINQVLKMHPETKAKEGDLVALDYKQQLMEKNLKEVKEKILN